LINNELLGYTCYNASAGTGKTTKIINLVKDAMTSGIVTSKILMLAFENSAKDTLINKLEMIGLNKMPIVKTVHSLAYSIIKDSGDSFNVISDYQQYIIMSKTIQDLKKGTGRDYYHYRAIHTINHYLSLFSMFNVNGRDEKRIKLSEDELIIFDEYTYNKKKKNNIDFGDMLYEAYNKLLDPIFLKTYMKQYQYIIVDEFQDIGSCGFSIIKMLASNNGNLLVVGDQKQAIFGSFAGSSVEFITGFDDIFDKADIKQLERTYRTPRDILFIANNIANDIDDISIETNSSIKGYMDYKIYQNSQSEAKEILNKIINERMDINDTAILYRANSSSMWFQKECISKGIPFYTKSGSFLETPIAKLMVSYVRFILTGCEDIQMFMNIANKPSRYIKTTTISLQHKSNRNKSLRDIISFLNNKNATRFYNDLVGIMNILEDVSNEKKVSEALRHCWVNFRIDKYLDEEYEEDITDEVESFIDFIKNIESPERLFDIIKEVKDNNKNKNGVNLLTIHGAKGMEFENVFITTINDGVIPNANNDDYLEELRLFYVAITRTKNNLHLSSIKYRNDKKIEISTYINEYIK
jgi:DNA helicase-2/ATP-dependent DNA helicase PcrA